MRDEVLTLRLPKGTRTRLAKLPRRKRQDVSHYVRDAIEAKLWIDALDESSALVSPAPLPARVCRDPDEDFVLATVNAAASDLIITGEKDLLFLRSHAGIRIRLSRQFSDNPNA